MSAYSIILPVRNGGHLVTKCVASVLGQSFSNFNLVVLDNKSSDGTYEWIQSLNDARIQIYRSDRDLTIEENWSRILTVRRNEFMTMIGHDDILHPDYLSEIDKLIKRHPSATLYQTHFNYIDKDGVIIKTCLPMDEVQSAPEFLAFHMNQTIDSTGTGYMMRSVDFDAVGGMPAHYPNLIFADYELWIRLGKMGYKATSSKNCFSYRVHQSVSRSTNGMAYQVAFGHYVKFITDLRNETPFEEVIQRYGSKMLLSFCESLSHRLLKTPISKRTINVATLVQLFGSYAERMIPSQPFNPLEVPRIRYAVILDSTTLSRAAFTLYKRLSNPYSR